jgi:hypothetical protein
MFRNSSLAFPAMTLIALSAKWEIDEILKTAVSQSVLYEREKITKFLRNCSAQMLWLFE